MIGRQSKIPTKTNGYFPAQRINPNYSSNINTHGKHSGMRQDDAELSVWKIAILSVKLQSVTNITRGDINPSIISLLDSRPAMKAEFHNWAAPTTT